MGLATTDVHLGLNPGSPPGPLYLTSLSSVSLSTGWEYESQDPDSSLLKESSGHDVCKVLLQCLVPKFSIKVTVIVILVICLLSNPVPVSWPLPHPHLQPLVPS